MTRRPRLWVAALVATPLACVPVYAFVDGDGGVDASHDARAEAQPGETGPNEAGAIDGGVDGSRVIGDAGPWSLLGNISLGGAHGCVLRGGVPYCWGDNSASQLGRGDGGPASTYRIAPVRAPDGGAMFTGVTELQSGRAFACAISQSRPFCWGGNALGQLGSDTFDGYAIPNAVVATPPLTDVARISVGGYTGCAQRTNGEVVCWGNNQTSQLTSDKPLGELRAAERIPSLQGLTSLVFGEDHACGIESDGHVLCWGKNDYLQTGQATSAICSVPSDGDYPCVKTPMRVNGVSGAVQLALGDHHSCALEQGGAVKCWGRNMAGELGQPPSGATCADKGRDGGPTAPCTATPVVAIDGGVSQIAIGENTEGATSCAVAGGVVSCWGANGYNELGRGANDNAAHPDPFPVRDTSNNALKGALETAAGPHFHCAIVGDAAVLCWGFDATNDGELGIPDAIAPYATPTQW